MKVKVVDEEEEDLRAEKRVLESIIVKITKDINEGTITERAHRKLVAKYVAQLRALKGHFKKGRQHALKFSLLFNLYTDQVAR